MTEQTPENRPRRGRALAILALMLLFLLAAVFALLQSGPVKRGILTFAGDQVEALAGYTLTATGPSGMWPFSIGLDTLSIGDADGVFFEARDLRAGLSFTALFRGQVLVPHLTLAEAWLHRLPETEDKDPDEPFAMPVFEAWPALPRWLEATDLAVGALHIADPVYPDLPILALSGSVVPRNAPAVVLHVRSRDDDTLDLRGEMDVSTDDLALTVALLDRTVVSGLLDAAVVVDGTVSASGPPQDLRLEAQVNADEAPLLALDATLRLEEVFSGLLDGTLRLDSPLLAQRVPEEVRAPLVVSFSGFRLQEETLVLAPSTVVLGTDQPLLQAELQADLPLDGSRISVDAEARTHDLNLLRPGLDEDPLPMALSLRLDGPREALAAEFRAMLRETEAATGVFDLALGETLAVEGQFRLYPLRDLLGDAAADLFREGMEVHLAANRHPESGYTVDSFEVWADDNLVTAKGRASADFSAMEWSLDVAADRLAVFAPLSPVPLEGAVHATARIEAGEEGTGIRAEGTMTGLVVADFRSASGALSVAVDGGALPDALLEGLSVNMEGTLAEVTAPGYAAESVRLEATARPDDDAVILQHLLVDDGNASLRGEGRVLTSLDELRLDLVVRAENLAPYVPSPDRPVHVSLDGEVRLERLGADTPFALNAGLNFAGRPNAPAEWTALVGTQTGVTLAATVDEVRANLSELLVDGPALRLEGSGAYRFEEGRVDAEGDLALRDLGRFSGLLDTTLAGALSLRFTAEGNLENALAVEGAVDGDGIRYDTVQADALRGTVRLSGLPGAPTGQVRLSVDHEGETLDGEATFAQTDAGLELPALRIALAENEVTGTVRANLESGDATGDLSVNLPRIDAFAPIIGQPVSGSLGGAIRFSREGTSVGLVGQLAGQDIRFPPADLSVTSLALNTDMAGTLPAMVGDLNLGLEGAAIGGSTIREASVLLSGDGVGYLYAVELEGAYEQDYPLVLNSAGRASADGGEMLVEALEGALGPLPLRLLSPLRVLAADGHFEVPPFELQVGEARLRGRASIHEESVDGELRLAALELEPLVDLGLPPMSGTLDGEVLLSGRPDLPTLRANLALKEFYPDLPEPGRERTTLNADFDAVVAEGIARGALRLDAGGAMSANARAETPFLFSVSPFAATLPEDASLVGSIEAEGALKALGQALGLEDHLLDGEIEARFTLSGTPASPRMTGGAEWRNGRYENTATSTIYSDIQAVLSAEGREIVLSRFEGRDPTGGAISADGRIDLRPEDAFPFRFEARANRTRIVHRDDVSAFADGVLVVSGDTGRILVEGDLTAGPATIVVPERLPASELRVVEYTEVNREAAGLAPVRERETAAPAVAPEIHFDIKVNMPNQVYVRAAALDSEWRGNLEILGTATDPRVGGTLQVIRGHVDFLGRRFDLRTSSISFDRSVEPSPYLDILAATQTREVVARVRARGEFSELEITMESEPPLPQDEILSQVLFNRNLSEVSPLQAVQLAQAAAALRGGSSGTRLLGGGTVIPGIDRLDFRQGTTPGETAIGVGKNLGDNIYVEVQQSVGVDSSKVLVEVEVTPNFSIQAEAGASATSGVGVFYKKDY